MRSLRALLLLIAVPLLLTACQKKAEEARPETAKKVEPLPALSVERVELWLAVAADLRDYVRKFSMEGEAVEDKRDLLMLAHSSARTQLAYGELFKSQGMTTKEFWHILEEMEKVGKYVNLKGEEAEQAKRIDLIVAAGRQELEALKAKAARAATDEARVPLERSAAEMEAKIAEFEGMKGNVQPQDFGISGELMALWEARWPEMEKMLRSVWKSDGAPTKDKPAARAGK